MIARLETMVLMGGELPAAAVRGQIGSALDVLIHLGRMRDGSRKVLESVEVSGDEGGQVRCRALVARGPREGRLSGGGEVGGGGGNVGGGGCWWSRT